jgi:hypothetical protein
MRMPENCAASLCSASKCAGTLRKSQTSPHQESIFCASYVMSISHK